MTEVFSQANRLTSVWVRTVLTVLLSACWVSPLAYAQAEISTHPSVVLVLKLVSATHVKPVTGIVLSGNGLVLVPAEFVSDLESVPATEIVVLDGGGDIFSHGRPATVKHASLPGGLAILEVKGLGRPGITLAEPGYNAEDVFHLAAFPPAESIARGDEPLWVAARVSSDDDTGLLAISPQTRLPNVSGAIIDNCGYMAALSIASGVQSLETGKNPATLFYPDLKPALEAAQVNLPVAACAKPLPGDKPVTPETETAVLDGNMAQKEPGTPPGDSTRGMAVPEPVEQTGTANATPAPVVPVIGNDAAIGSVMSKPANRPSLWSEVPWWVFVAGLLILAVLIWKVLFFIRLQRKTANSKINSALQPASDEPDTTRLQPANREAGARPRSGRNEAIEIPDLNQLPDGCDAFVMLQGMLDQETSFNGYCAVSQNQLDIVIGRGDADIRIEHPLISRRHVRIMVEGDSMTLSDLGSSNGTYIGVVPCLPGDIMYIQTTDQIFLGDLGFNIRIISKESEAQ